MCRFFWSRDLFISQGHGLYIKYVNHDLTVMMLNILKCSYPYAKAVVVILYEKPVIPCHRKYRQSDYRRAVIFNSIYVHSPIMRWVFVTLISSAVAFSMAYGTTETSRR